MTQEAVRDRSCLRIKFKQNRTGENWHKCLMTPWYQYQNNQFMFIAQSLYNEGLFLDILTNTQITPCHNSHSTVTYVTFEEEFENKKPLFGKLFPMLTNFAQFIRLPYNICTHTEKIVQQEYFQEMVPAFYL